MCSPRGPSPGLAACKLLGERCPEASAGQGWLQASVDADDTECRARYGAPTLGVWRLGD
jgi:hypothetical protein